MFRSALEKKRKKTFLYSGGGGGSLVQAGRRGMVVTFKS